MKEVEKNTTEAVKKVGKKKVSKKKAAKKVATPKAKKVKLTVAEKAAEKKMKKAIKDTQKREEKCDKFVEAFEKDLKAVFKTHGVDAVVSYRSEKVDIYGMMSNIDSKVVESGLISLLKVVR